MQSRYAAYYSIVVICYGDINYYDFIFIAL